MASSVQPVGVQGSETTDHTAPSASIDTTCHILTCPAEILIMFSEFLVRNMASRAAMARTCKTLYRATEADNSLYPHGLAMVLAAKNNQVDALQQAVEKGGNIFHYHRWALLHHAVASNSRTMVQYLVGRGVDLHLEVDGFCECPSNHPPPPQGDMARLFHVPAVTPSRTSTVQPALHVAICHGYKNMALFLMGNGAFDNHPEPLYPRQKAIRTAAAFGRSYICSSIHMVAPNHNLGDVVNARQPSNDEPRGTSTPSLLDYAAVHYAVMGPKPNGTTLGLFYHLLRLGKGWRDRTAAPNQSGMTAFDLAVTYGRWDLASWFPVWNPNDPTNGAGLYGKRKFEPLLGFVMDRLLGTHDRSILPPVKLANEGVQLASRLIGGGASFREAYASITRKVELLPIGCKEYMHPHGLLVAAQLARGWDAAPIVLEFLVQGGAPVNEVDRRGHGGMTALTTLVTAFDIDYEKDYDVPFEETLHGHLDTYSDQLHIWAKERHLFKAIEVLLEADSPLDAIHLDCVTHKSGTADCTSSNHPLRITYPPDFVDFVNDGCTATSITDGQRPMRLLDMLLDRFPLDDHQYVGHRSARAGLNTLKLARLFRKSMKKVEQVSAYLEEWIRRAFRVMREKPPVTDPSVRNANWYPSPQLRVVERYLSPAGQDNQRMRPTEVSKRRQLDQFGDDDVFYANRPLSVPAPGGWGTILQRARPSFCCLGMVLQCRRKRMLTGGLIFPAWGTRLPIYSSRSGNCF
ncbi:hypothetical protein V8F33_004105 [Rhypophila sp. PSN 637]